MTDRTQPDESSKQSPEENGANHSLPPRELLPFPGLAAIAFYLLVLAGVIILGVVGRHYPAAFLVLSACSLAASAGLILLLRWAWALSLATVFLLACYNL